MGPEEFEAKRAGNWRLGAEDTQGTAVSDCPTISRSITWKAYPMGTGVVGWVRCTVSLHTRVRVSSLWALSVLWALSLGIVSASVRPGQCERMSCLGGRRCTTPRHAPHTVRTPPSAPAVSPPSHSSLHARRSTTVQRARGWVPGEGEEGELENGNGRDERGGGDAQRQPCMQDRSSHAQRGSSVFSRQQSRGLVR